MKSMLKLRTPLVLASRCRCDDTLNAAGSLSKYLKSRIRLLGPISVADYMREVLTNPKAGYYMQRDVFGSAGDFTTSPEISQMFGEIMGVWIANQWQRIGSPEPFQLVELGPGRGTMMSDVLRVLDKLGIGSDVMDVRLVEVSEELSRAQSRILCAGGLVTSTNDSSAHHLHGVTAAGVQVTWHRTVSLLPHVFSVVLAHEFFDALPIHKFQRTGNVWREIFVDVDPLDEDKLRFVLSDVPTPASCLLVKKDEVRDHVEVSPEAGAVMQLISSRLEAFGGFGLIVDYGHSGEKQDTFRAFRQHRLQPPLSEPGSADLTADVDFSYLKEAVQDKLITFGPVCQRDFLRELCIDVRLEKLLVAAPSELQDDLMSGYNMIMDERGMGTAFKVLSFFPAVLDLIFKDHPPAGFHKLVSHDLGSYRDNPPRSDL